MSFASIHRRKDVNELKEKFNQLNGKGSYSDLDETYWDTKHVAGPEGVGEAVIRFLPAPPTADGQQEPDFYVTYHQYSVNRNGKLYINRGRDSLGRDVKDPANEYNITIWTDKTLSKEEKIKRIVDKQEFYIANIYVVKDPNKPENEGKVFRWRFGRKIYNLIQAKMFPEFESEKSIDVFDPETGADFYFRVVMKEIADKRDPNKKRKVPNYDNAKFGEQSCRWKYEEFDPIWKMEHSLQSEVAEDKYKSYEELKQHFDRVMGFDSSDTKASDAPVREERREKTAESKPNREAESSGGDFNFDFDSDRNTSQATSKLIDDDIPWDTDDSSKSSSSKDSSSDVDDWFNNLGS